MRSLASVFSIPSPLTASLSYLPLRSPLLPDAPSSPTSASSAVFVSASSRLPQSMSAGCELQVPDHLLAIHCYCTRSQSSHAIITPTASASATVAHVPRYIPRVLVAPTALSLILLPCVHSSTSLFSSSPIRVPSYSPASISIPYLLPTLPAAWVPLSLVVPAGVHSSV